jgi:hypothetical protein
MNLTIKYNRSSVHIDGLAMRTIGGEFDYARSHCPAISRSVNFCTAQAQATTVAGALDEARTLAKGLGLNLCKKCVSAAEAMIEAAPTEVTEEPETYTVGDVAWYAEGYEWVKVEFASANGRVIVRGVESGIRMQTTTGKLSRTA